MFQPRGSLSVTKLSSVTKLISFVTDDDDDDNDKDPRG